MNISDIRKDALYTDNNSRYRLVIAFYDGFNGERRVQYEKGYIDWKYGGWKRFGNAENCTKKTFARWARKEVNPS